MAHVEKLAKIDKVEKYPLVRQDLFGRIVDAKGMGLKDSKRTVGAFLTVNTNKQSTQGKLTREQIWLESSKKYAKQKEYKFTLQ